MPSNCDISITTTNYLLYYRYINFLLISLQQLPFLTLRHSDTHRQHCIERALLCDPPPVTSESSTTHRSKSGSDSSPLGHSSRSTKCLISNTLTHLTGINYSLFINLLGK